MGSVIPAFLPPGDVADMNASTRAIWSKDFVDVWVQGEIDADPNVVSPGRTKLTQFFNGTVTPYNNSAQTPVTWVAFPKLVATAFPATPLRWQVADASRMFQDEYLEWSAARNANKEILEVTFTCEGPEYWQVYASYQQQDFINTMRSLNADFSSQMNDSDFFLTDPKTGNTVYNPNNYWNVWSTTGSICHLIQPNNTLSAEIDIAAQATVIREMGGKIVTDPNQLILCSQYGNPGRNSDPTIGGAINGIVRGTGSNGASISVANPIALYAQSDDFNNKLQAGLFMYDMSGSTRDPPILSNLKAISNPSEVFSWTRFGVDANGNTVPNQGLRLRVKVPTGVIGNNGVQLNVSNIVDTSTKKHLMFGAQIADHVLMSVSAVSIPHAIAPALPCVGASASSTPTPASDAAATTADVAAEPTVVESAYAAVKGTVQSALGTKEHIASKISVLPKGMGRHSHSWSS